MPQAEFEAAHCRRRNLRRHIAAGGTDNGGTPLAFIFGEFGSVGYYVGFKSLR